MPIGIYNHKKGIYHHSEETKRKIGEANKISLKGRKLGQEQIDKMKKWIGDKNPFYGKKHSEETIKKISKNRKGKCIGKDHHNYGRYDYGIKRHMKRKKQERAISNIVWCKENQIHRVPFNKDTNGCLIHHIDGNLENNNPNNLQLMTRDFHAKLHWAYKQNLMEIKQQEKT